MDISVPNVSLTDRDIEFFRYLNEQKFMVSGQIDQIFWPASDPVSGTARQRLTKLTDSGHVKTSVVRVEKKKKNLKLFLLTERGIEVLRRKGLDHGFEEVFVGVNVPLIEHSLKLTNIRGLFKELGQTDWRSERVIRKEDWNRGWFPDGILQVNGFKVAIELENSLRGKDRYTKRFALYEGERVFDLAIFVLSNPYVRSWIFDLKAPQDKVCFVDYDDLIQKKGDVELENFSSKIILSSIL